MATVDGMHVPEHRVSEYFDGVDRMSAGDPDDAVQLERFLEHYVEDVEIRRGNLPAINGRGAFGRIIARRPSSVVATKHHILATITSGDTAAVELNVDFVLGDGRTITVPCATVIRFRGERVASVHIYLDDAPVRSG